MKIDLFVAVRYQNRKFVLAIFCNVLDYFWTCVLFYASILVKRSLIIVTLLLLLLLLLIFVRVSVTCINLSFSNITKRTQPLECIMTISHV